MRDKEITTEGREEAQGLTAYTPTLEEFNNYIDTLNPRSAGGLLANVPISKTVARECKEKDV